MTTTVEAVAQRAASYNPTRFALAAIAFPFYLVGIVLAVLWVAGAWCVAMGRQGFDDARDRAAGGS